MAYAHIAGQMLDALALSKDFSGHAIALALVDSPALAYCDTRSILSPLFCVSVAVPRRRRMMCCIRESIKGD